MTLVSRYHLSMNVMHELHRIDLNLLVALDALIREGSVTRAAQEVGVTQSAMSHTLRRLRDVFDDPLLVRVGAAMQLTPRAEALALGLRSGLQTLARLLESPSFEPASAQRAFRIATPDLFDVLALPALLADLRQQAPGIELTVMPFTRRGIPAALTVGELDLAVLARPQVQGAVGLVGRTLLRDTFSCFLREDHAVLRQGLTLERYVAAAHAVVSPRADGVSVVDHLLQEAGHVRRVVLKLPHFFSAPAIIARSDLILTAPTSLARMLPAEGPIVAVPLPLPVPPHSVACYWHTRFTEDPGHRWLRERLASAVPAEAREPS